MSTEGTPYKCPICGKLFMPGQYLNYLKHKKEANH